MKAFLVTVAALSALIVGLFAGAVEAHAAVSAAPVEALVLTFAWANVVAMLVLTGVAQFILEVVGHAIGFLVYAIITSPVWFPVAAFFALCGSLLWGICA